jgi:hypothetical protein
MFVGGVITWRACSWMDLLSKAFSALTMPPVNVRSPEVHGITLNTVPHPRPEEHPAPPPQVVP